MGMKAGGDAWEEGRPEGVEAARRAMKEAVLCYDRGRVQERGARTRTAEARELRDERELGPGMDDAERVKATAENGNRTGSL